MARTCCDKEEDDEEDDDNDDEDEGTIFAPKYQKASKKEKEEEYRRKGRVCIVKITRADWKSFSHSRDGFSSSKAPSRNSERSSGSGSRLE